MTLSANAQIDVFVDQEIISGPVAAGEYIYGGALLGKDPAGYLKPYEPPDVFAGVAYEEADNSSGAAGAINVRFRTTGDPVLPLTGVAQSDVGAEVFATADDTIAAKGHPDGYVGKIIEVAATNKARVRLRCPGERPMPGVNCLDLSLKLDGAFDPTGNNGADAAKYLQGWIYRSTLGLGVLAETDPNAGALLKFDAVAEIALANFETPALFAVDQGIKFETEIAVNDEGDDAALDLDFGLGTLLTANSRADIDHADMVQLVGFHLDGNALSVHCQSDDNTTDTGHVDSTVDVVAATPIKAIILVRPTGVGELWIDGVRVLSTTSFAVLSTADLGAFINLEKTSNDTTAEVLIANARVSGGKT